MANPILIYLEPAHSPGTPQNPIVIDDDYEVAAFNSAADPIPIGLDNAEGSRDYSAENKRREQCGHYLVGDVFLELYITPLLGTTPSILEVRTRTPSQRLKMRMTAEILLVCLIRPQYPCDFHRFLTIERFYWCYNWGV